MLSAERCNVFWVRFFEVLINDECSALDAITIGIDLVTIAVLAGDF